MVDPNHGYYASPYGASRKRNYPECEVVQLIITLFAQPGILQKVRDHGLLVVQSFEW